MDINRIPAYFRVYFQSQTWRNIAYLLLAFPTGMIYFILLSIGLSLAGSLLIVGIGFLILYATGVGILAAGEFERKISNELLHTEIPPLPATTRNTDSFGENLKAMFSFSMLRLTFYLTMKSIFAVFALIAAIFAVAIPFGMFMIPVGYLIGSPEFQTGPDGIESFPEAIVIMLIGLALAPLFIHGANLLTKIWAIFAESMLGPNISMVEVPSDYSYDEDFYPSKRKNDLDAVFGDDDVYIAKPKRTLEPSAAIPTTNVNESRSTNRQDNEEPPKRSLGDLVRQTMESEQAASNGRAKH